MIPKLTISKIIDAAHIDEVVGEFVSLKKRGSSLIGCCPFHNEKTPSFNVSVAKNIYKCFGCGKAGNSITFLMEHQQLSYTEALRYLAKKYNIEVVEEFVSEEKQREDEIKHSQQESILIVNQFAQRFFTDYMLNNEEGRVGLAYFKERGFSQQTIDKFQLGFSPESGSLLTETGLKQGYQLDILKKAGLTSSKEDSRFDFFRNRAMFPIHNLMGKVIAFGGRIMKKDEKAPKYVNTPESDVYIKSKILYGIFQAKNDIRKKDECLLCEGYTDVISLVQNGIENVVASSGTALTVDQIKLVKRFTNNITLLYDGDSAGVKAALRGTDLILEEGMNVRIVVLPEPEDPDSYIKKVGTTAFEEYVKTHKQDLILFKSSLFAAEAKHDPIKKAELIKDIISSVAKIPDAIQRSVYLRSCAEKFGMSEQLLIIEVNKLRRKNQTTQPKGEEYQGPPSYEQQAESELHKVQQVEITIPSLEYYERDIVRILMEFGAMCIKYDEQDETIAKFIFDELEGIEFETKYKNAFDFIKHTDPPLETNAFMHHEDQAIATVAYELLTSQHEISEGWWKRYQVIVPDKQMLFQKDMFSAVLRLKQYHSLEQVRTIEQQLQTETDEMKQIELLKKLQVLNAQRIDFNNETGTVIFRPNMGKS